VRACAGVFAFVFPVVLLVWPIATAGRAEFSAGEPWIWFLLNVGTAAAVLAFRMPLQILWAGFIPVLYGVVRTIQVGVDDLFATILNVVFAIILALVFVVLGWMLRSMAKQMDIARRDAVASYAAAAAADAAERERVAVAALMHDSVLAALIAAERAHTPRERSLAVSMAREALTRLANVDQDAGEGSDAPVPLETFVSDLELASLEAGGPDVVNELPEESWSLPGRVARALVLAATQAIANAVEHADGAGLVVSVVATEQRVEILIGDSGPGFDPAAVPDDRLGIRGSISARVAAVAGTSRIESDHTGTQVTLVWERTP
ncbi:MAG: ATP-binding protein, partial [Microbacterium sp.]